ncbi:MAG: hypothetical protein ACI8WT_004557 [Clostridium sp.]|jgi:hypothetical protein
MDERKKQQKKECMYMSITFVIALILACYFMKVWYFPWSKPETVLGFQNGDLLLANMSYKNMLKTGSMWQGIQLGAPFNFELYDFPALANLIITVPLFLFGNLFNSSVIGMFIIMIFAFPITAVLSYYAIRQFKIQNIISMIGAIVFAFIPFKLMRNWSHFSYGNSLLVIPIAVTLLYWLYEDKELLVITKDMFKYKKNILTVLFIVVIGIGEVYFAYFFCFFVAVTTLIMLLNDKDRILNIKKGFTMVVGIILTVIINLSPSIINSLRGLGTTEPPIRSAVETEIYGLKLMHLFLPPNTGINFLDSAFNKYVSTTIYNNENTTAFLGIFGCIGFFILLIGLLSNGFFKKREKEIKFLSKLNIGALLLSSIGGFSFLISEFILSSVRAYNRISVFIAFFSVLALCIVSSMLIEYSNKIIYKRIIIVCIGFIGFISIIFNGATNSCLTTKNIYGYAKNNEYIYDFIKEIEGQVSENAMIYEMPYYKFPESPPQNGMSDYSLSLPYVYSNNNLRWSYGLYKGTFGDLWHRATAQLPMQDRIMKLSDVGFEGIYIDSAAYLPTEMQNLLQELNNILEIKPIIGSDNRMYFYSMKKYNESLDGKSEEGKNNLNDMIYMKGPGMYDTETNENEKWIWNDKKSTLYVLNNSKEPLKKSFKMKVSISVNQYSNMHIECNKESFDFKVNNQGTSCNVDFNLQLGINKIKFSTNAPKVNAPLDNRSLYFKITNFDFMK